MIEVLVAAGSNVEPHANLRRALDVVARHFYSPLVGVFRPAATP